MKLKQKHNKNRREKKSSLLKIILSVFYFLKSMFLKLILTYSVLSILIFSSILIIVGISFDILNTIDISSILKDKPKKEVHIKNPSDMDIWDITTLERYKKEYTVYEQNLYRMFILYKQSLGYMGDTNTYLNTREKMSFLFGFSSVETSMSFYKNGKNDNIYNILEIPSDKPKNSIGYAFLGLWYGATLEEYRGGGSTYLSKNTIDYLKSNYIPSTVPLYTVNYAPYGVAIQTHLMEKDYLNRVFNCKDLDAILQECVVEYNIQDVESLKGYIYYFLASAQYHGAKYEDYESYISFWVGLWSALERQGLTFDDIRIAKDIHTYSESFFRESIMSYHYGKKSVSQKYNPAYTPNRIYFEIKGVGVKESIWSYVAKNCTNHTYFRDTALAGYLKLIDRDTDFVLNYHYGLLSYIVGNTVRVRLIDKIPLQDNIYENNTLAYTYGGNTVKNMLSIAMKPVGRTMYSWGGGRPTPKGFQSNWEEFYIKQKNKNERYNFKDFTSNGNPTTQTRINGLDCSGFTGWVIYNNRGDNGYYSLNAKDQGVVFARRNLGRYIPRNKITNYRPGDLMMNKGHIYIVIGESRKGGIVLVHASPNGVKLGGFGGGEETAKYYMEKYFEDVSNKKIPFNFGTFKNNYEGKYDQFRWVGLADPDGYLDMKAEDILEDLFKN